MFGGKNLLDQPSNEIQLLENRQEQKFWIQGSMFASRYLLLVLGVLALSSLLVGTYRRYSYKTISQKI
jgi:hypothetical protein